MPHDLDEILSAVREHGPRVVLEMRVKLRIEEAQVLASTLRREGHSIEAYDFPRTQRIWLSEREDGVEYTQLATRQLILTLANERSVNPFDPEGFKLILPDLTYRSFKYKPINEWKTTLGGLISAYDNSPSVPVLAVVSNDRDFVEIKRKKLQASDFDRSPVRMWVNKRGKPTVTSRSMTKQLIKVVSAQMGVDYRVPADFQQVCGRMTYDFFIATPINFWGTTLSSMLTVAHGNSTHAAITDLVNTDSEFEHMRREFYSLFPKPQHPFIKPASVRLSV